MPVRFQSTSGSTGKARAAIITDVKPDTFTVTGGPFSAKLYKSVAAAKFNDQKRTVKLGSYAFTFQRAADYARFARKMKTMK